MNLILSSRCRTSCLVCEYLSFSWFMSGLLTVVKSANLEPVSSISSHTFPSREIILVSNIGTDWTLPPFTVRISWDSWRAGFSFNFFTDTLYMKLRADPVSR